MSSWFGARQLLIFSSEKGAGFFVMINNFVKKLWRRISFFLFIKQIRNQSIAITLKWRYFKNLTRGSPEYPLLTKYQTRNIIYDTH